MDLMSIITTALMAATPIGGLVGTLHIVRSSKAREERAATAAEHEAVRRQIRDLETTLSENFVRKADLVPIQDDIRQIRDWIMPSGSHPSGRR